MLSYVLRYGLSLVAVAALVGLSACSNAKYKVIGWHDDSAACQISASICVTTPTFKRIDYEANEMLITYDSQQSDDAANNVLKKYKLRAKRADNLDSIKTTMITAATNGQDPEAVVQKIHQAEKDVDASTSNFFTTANLDTGPAALYPLGMTGVPLARERNAGKGVVIGMIDTPVDLDYGDTLQSPLIERIELVPAGDAQNRLHGTEVAGIMVSKNPRIGIAPDAKLVAISAFSTNPSNPGERRSNSGLVARALELAMKQGVDVLNLSFAGQSDPVVDRLVAEAVKRGIVVVASAGNNGPNAQPAYPAAIPGVIAVTAVDRQESVFGQANRGDYIALAAPGVGILTTAPRGAFQLSSGTSLATAHASGVIALLLAANRQAFTPEVLNRTAVDLGKPGRDSDYGFGLINTEQALRSIAVP
jgi:subtilisin family serine protease